MTKLESDISEIAELRKVNAHLQRELLNRDSTSLLAAAPTGPSILGPPPPPPPPPANYPNPLANLYAGMQQMPPLESSRGKSYTNKSKFGVVFVFHFSRL